MYYQQDRNFKCFECVNHLCQTNILIKIFIERKCLMVIVNCHILGTGNESTTPRHTLILFKIIPILIPL